MIWFGNLERLFIGPVPDGLPGAAEERRMQYALERVAEVAPSLTGDSLAAALAATGWVDRQTADRLLPAFRHFDPDRHFGDYLRRISFKGKAAEEEFRLGIRTVVQELTGGGKVCQVGPESCIRFMRNDFEGVVLSRPEVGLTIAGRTREAVLAAIEEMPDTIVIVARSFDRSAADQLRSLLRNTGIKGTLLTVNLLLGIRAIALRFQPSSESVVDLLAHGGALRSVDIARFGDRSVPQRFHMAGWNSSSTV